LGRFCRLIPWINTYCKVGSFVGTSAAEQEAEEIRRGDAPEGSKTERELLFAFLASRDGDVVGWTGLRGNR